ncbi:MAG: Trm112 family protein [Candidatus Dormibacteraceae bacterium]
MLSPQLLAVLACPRCKQKIQLAKLGQTLECKGCRLSYPIVDGIPVLLLKEAQTY